LILIDLVLTTGTKSLHNRGSKRNITKENIFLDTSIVNCYLYIEGEHSPQVQCKILSDGHSKLVEIQNATVLQMLGMLDKTAYLDIKGDFYPIVQVNKMGVVRLGELRDKPTLIRGR
jgi:hypothetical protein